MLVIEVRKKAGIEDIKGRGLKDYIAKNLKIPVYSIATSDVYAIGGDLAPGDAYRIGEELLADRVAEEHAILDQDVYAQPDVDPDFIGNWKVFVGYKRKPLVLDPWGNTTRQAIGDMGISVGPVRHLKGFLIGGGLTEEQIRGICTAKLADDKVEDFVYAAVEEVEDATG